MLFTSLFFVFLLSFALAAQAAPTEKANSAIPPRQKDPLLKVFGDLLASVIQAQSTASSATSRTATSTSSSLSSTSISLSATSSVTISSATTSTPSSTTTSSASAITSSISSATSSASSASSTSVSSSSTSPATGTCTAVHPTKTACDKRRKYNYVRLNNRIAHKSPKNQITLFHGIRDCEPSVSKLTRGPQRSCKRGDFNTRGQGAFYLTDEITAAAQYACYAKKKRDTVAVFEYEWSPSTSLKTYEFHNINRVWHAFVRKSNRFSSIGKNDLIAGPLSYRKDITGNYWQYAVTSDNGLKNLKLKAVHRGIKCSTIPRGNLC